MLTFDELKKCKSRTTVFLDGEEPAHQQMGHVVEHPKIEWHWHSSTKEYPKGRKTWRVGGKQFEHGQWDELIAAYNAMQND